jgi:hypothetical protein
MSTLVAQTISNGTVSTSSANVIQGSAKAWVNFNGTGTPSIRASYNVSSVTKPGTGDYRVNFTNTFADANYSFVASAINIGVAYALTSASPNNSASGTVATFIHSSPSTNADVNTICASAFR